MPTSNSIVARLILGIIRMEGPHDRLNKTETTKREFII